MLGYGYGVDAIRSHGRGAQSVGLLLQFDLGQAREALLNPDSPAAGAASSNSLTSLVSSIDHMEAPRAQISF